jgi:ADP-ribose pyrophosphatase YjhB (NUDIX family)
MGFDPLCSSDQVSPIVMEYIRRNHLYDQSTPEDYQKVEDLVLTKYDPFRFPRPSVTVTTAMFFDGCVLLVKRKAAPFHDYWCLPGGFANPKETVEETGIREVAEETGFTINVNQVHQVGVFKPADPRCDCHPDYWGYDVGVMVDFTREGILAGKPEAQDDAKDAMWCPLNLINDIKLAFHHRQIIDNALKLRQNL